MEVILNSQEGTSCLDMIKEAIEQLGEPLDGTPPMMYPEAISNLCAKRNRKINQLIDGIDGLEAVISRGGHIEFPNSNSPTSHNLDGVGIVNCFNKLLSEGQTLKDAIKALNHSVIDNQK